MMTIPRGLPDPGVDPGPDLPPPWNAEAALTLETYDGVGDTIHPSVVDMGEAGWRGYRYWLADTPYAGADNQLENPCIWAGNSPTDFVVPDGVINPLEPPPGLWIGFHSDTELVYDPEMDRMVMYYRTSYSNNPGGPRTIFIRALTSTDGVTWVDQWPLMEVPLTGGRLSPAVVRVGQGQWMMWLWGSYQHTATVFTADNPLGPWTGPINTKLGPHNLLGWHGDVILHQGKYYMAYSNDVHTEFRAATSDDGIHWTPARSPVLMSRRIDQWDRNLYRPTLSIDPEPGVIRMWYSAISPSSPGGHAIGYTRLPISAWD